MRLSRTALIPLVVAIGAMITGCSFNANLTVPASSVADVAAGALEEQIGTRPLIDCGDGNVDLVNGTEVECELTDPDTGTVFDSVATISGVDGRNYRVDIQVADTPKSGGEVAPAEPEATEPEASEPAATDSPGPADGQVVFDYDYEVAKVAAGALEAELGALPTVICEGDERSRVLIENGNTVDCLVVDALTGKRHNGVVTISDVVGTEYVVNIHVEPAAG